MAVHALPFILPVDDVKKLFLGTTGSVYPVQLTSIQTCKIVSPGNGYTAYPHIDLYLNPLNAAGVNLRITAPFLRNVQEILNSIKMTSK